MLRPASSSCAHLVVRHWVPPNKAALLARRRSDKRQQGDQSGKLGSSSHHLPGLVRSIFLVLCQCVLAFFLATFGLVLCSGLVWIGAM